MPAGGERLDVAFDTLECFYKAEEEYLASGSGDFSAIEDTLDPNCIIFQPSSLPYGGEWRGHSGFEIWMKAFAQEWSSMEVKDSHL